MQPKKYFDVRCNITELNGSNCKIWKEQILLYLRWMDTDYVIRNDEPMIIATSTQEEKVLYEQ